MKYFVALLFAFCIAANYGQTASISQSTSVINNQRCVKTCTDGVCQTSCSPVDSNSANNCVVCNGNDCWTCDQNPEEAKRIQAETQQQINQQQEQLKKQMDQQQEQLRQQMADMNNRLQQMNNQFREKMRRFQQGLQQQFGNQFPFN